MLLAYIMPRLLVIFFLLSYCLPVSVMHLLCLVLNYSPTLCAVKPCAPDERYRFQLSSPKSKGLPAGKRVKDNNPLKGKTSFISAPCEYKTPSIYSLPASLWQGFRLSSLSATGWLLFFCNDCSWAKYVWDLRWMLMLPLQNSEEVEILSWRSWLSKVMPLNWADQVFSVDHLGNMVFFFGRLIFRKAVCACKRLVLPLLCLPD